MLTTGGTQERFLKNYVHIFVSAHKCALGRRQQWKFEGSIFSAIYYFVFFFKYFISKQFLIKKTFFDILLPSDGTAGNRIA